MYRMCVCANPILYVSAAPKRRVGRLREILTTESTQPFARSACLSEGRKKDVRRTMTLHARSFIDTIRVANVPSVIFLEAKLDAALIVRRRNQGELLGRL